MKKIGLYLDAVQTGGTFQYNLSILEAFKSFPNDKIVTVITYSSDLWDSYLKKKNIDAKRINRTLFSRAWHQFRCPFWLWRKINKFIDPFTKSFINEKCDLWIFPSQDIWSYSLPIPSLSTVHDLMHRYEQRFPEAGSDKEFKSREKHYSMTCNYSKGILVDSELGKQQLIDSYDVLSNKVFVLPFIAPNYIYNENKDTILEYELPEKYIFYPAQFWEHKNHKGLVQAASLLIAKIPDLRMVFVGAPNNGYNSLKQLIEELNLQDVFVFLDHVSNYHMTTLYKNARALIMPTFFGPTNIPPLEAFATDCPVAVSNNYAMPEQVGDAGLLFDPNSHQEIADIIYRLWTDDNLIQLLSKKGLEKSKNWGQEQFNQKLFEIINNVTKKN